MINDKIDQVAVRMDQVHLIPKIEKLLVAEGLPELGWRLAATLWLFKVIHPLGIHYWVKWRQYDEASDRLLHMGLVCRYCPKGRLR